MAHSRRSGDEVTGFVEKPRGDGGMINGGFFVLSPKVLGSDRGRPDESGSLTLGRLAHQGELMAFEHHGFWQPMDTLRDKNTLEEEWSGRTRSRDGDFQVGVPSSPGIPVSRARGWSRPSAGRQGDRGQPAATHLPQSVLTRWY